MTLYNRNGIKFNASSENGKTRVACGNTSMLMDVKIATFLDGWFKWRVRGKFIQDAFPMLSALERDFLLTGLTPEELEALIKIEDKR
jgi:hypothetical protein